MKKLTTLLFLITFNTFAVFSQLVFLTPENQHEYDFAIKMESVSDTVQQINLRSVESYQSVWLIQSSENLTKEEQAKLRSHIWFGESGTFANKTVKVTPLQPVKNKDYEYSVKLNNHEIQHALIYVDFSHEIDDGGYYYSIDLKTYLDNADK